MAYIIELEVGAAVRIGDALVRVLEKSNRRTRLAITAPGVKIQSITAEQELAALTEVHERRSTEPHSWQTPSTTRAANGS